MLDGMTALGFMAAHSEKARIGLMVGGIHYRAPGLWIKAHTTLDVLTGGRAWFGIGAAWNEEESVALGFPMPPLRRAVRVAGGHPADGVRHVERRVGQRGALRGQAGHRHPPAELAAGDQPAASADHDRRRWRAEDAAPGRAVRGCLQRLRRPGSDRAQVRRAARALRAAGPPLRGDRALEPAGGRPGHTNRPTRWWSDSARWARPAAQHVIFSVRGVTRHRPSWSALGAEVFPQLRQA